jgi:O-antigen biosynthesis protein
MAIPKYHMAHIFDPTQAGDYDSHTLQMQLVPSATRVLELGCASGYIAGYMERALGCRVTGLDFDADAVAIARQRCSEAHTVDLDAPDAFDVVRANAPYDVLYAANVLEHLRFPERVLQQARGLLTDDAHVIVALPNIANWRFRLMLLAGRFDYTDYGVMDRTHTRLYTFKTGRELLEQNGYRVIETHIAGSFVQNTLMSLGSRLGAKQRQIPLVLPGLFAYELIYLAQPDS